MSFLANASGQWALQPGSKPVSFYPFKFLFNEMWHHILKHYIYSVVTRLTMNTGLSGAPDEKLCGLRKTTWRAVIVTAIRSLIHHPFRVGHLHFSLQPVGTELNFSSTLQAMAKIASVSPLYLFTGLAEEMVAQISNVLLTQEIVVPLIAPLKQKYTALHDLALAGLSVIICAPTSIISNVARSNTPLLRNTNVFRPAYPSYLAAVAGIWHTEGIKGFFRGWPFMIAQRFLALSFIRSWDYLSKHTNLYHYSWQRSAFFSVLTAVSFLADLACSFPRKYPWEDPQFPLGQISQ